MKLPARLATVPQLAELDRDWPFQHVATCQLSTAYAWSLAGLSGLNAGVPATLNG